MADIAFNTNEELGYIAPEEAHTKVFEGLTEKQIVKYKDAFGMLKPNNQLWLCIAILRYRHEGYVSKNRNPFMQNIFLRLIGKETSKVVTKEVIKEVPVEVPVPAKVSSPSFLTRLSNIFKF